MIELLLQAERALSVGLLDRADVLYRQVAKADPRNSIAVVGLARVTLDRGDDIQALALARKALAIDPENTAAQRMVARLEEVLDFRDAARDLDAQPATADVAEAEAAPVETGERPQDSAPTPGLAPEPIPTSTEVDEFAEPTGTEPGAAEPMLEADVLPAPEVEPVRSTETDAPEVEPARSTETDAPATRTSTAAAVAGSAATMSQDDAFAAPDTEPARSPEPEPEPAQQRRRSWLDRLFGRP